MWLIDENAKILRTDVCAKPPKAPITAEKEIVVVKINFLKFVSRQATVRIKGANFCQIRIIKLFNHCNPSTTWGTQK
jgi:hypothetical protein